MDTTCPCVGSYDGHEIIWSICKSQAYKKIHFKDKEKKSEDISGAMKAAIDLMTVQQQPERKKAS